MSICKKYQEPENPTKDFEDKVFDYCQDPVFCKRAGADYLRMNHNDVQKIREYIKHQNE